MALSKAGIMAMMAISVLIIHHVGTTNTSTEPNNVGMGNTGILPRPHIQASTEPNAELPTPADNQSVVIQNKRGSRKRNRSKTGVEKLCPPAVASSSDYAKYAQIGTLLLLTLISLTLFITNLFFLRELTRQEIRNAHNWTRIESLYLMLPRHYRNYLQRENQRIHSSDSDSSP